MTAEKHQAELQQLFPDLKIKTIPGDNPKEVKLNIKRELSRLELGHLFSLGMNEVRRSGEGITYTFDLTKASLNDIYQPHIVK